MKKFRCKLCGYIYEAESLEITYVCSVCGVDASHFEEYEEVVVENRVKVDVDNPAIYRIVDKCINCGQCKNICKEVLDGRSGVCINCGQCILGCPAGALVPKYNYKEVEGEIKNGKVVVAFTSPAVRVALGEEFGMDFGSFVEGKMVSALRELGFSYVFDTTFGADITIMEEVSELIDRIDNGGVLPMFTSCCPSWVKYAEVFHPELLGNISSTKSPIAMQSVLIKDYFSKVSNINKEDIVTVAITPCTAKKMEARREELGTPDYVITTSELAIYLRENAIDFASLEDGVFDSLMGKGTGSGVIFGNSGGVMEASIRTLYFMKTGKRFDGEVLDLRGQNDIKEASIEIDGVVYNFAVLYGMKAVNRFLEMMESKEYHFVEVMNCPGGCIGGGGQPLKAIGKLHEAREMRINALYSNDNVLEKKCSYENEEVKSVYDNYLGCPYSEKAREVLHTTYSDKSNLVKEKVKS